MILENLNIVLIGGSSAIGSNFAVAAKKNGAKIINIGRTNPNISGLDHIDADIKDIDSIQNSIEKILLNIEKIDVVINFIGTHHTPMNFLDGDPVQLINDFERVIEINLISAFSITMLFGKSMMLKKHGHIIHLCSNASRLSLYGSYAYNASKHGVEGLIKTAATQFAPYRVRVNGVAPGTVETDLNRKLLRNSSNNNFTKRATSILAHTPTKKFATLEGITESLIATCIPQRHLTGNLIFCDDGYNVEGHSWPDGNLALFEGEVSLNKLFSDL